MSFNTDSLESMCELIVDCPHSTPEWTETGVIVLRNQNIKSGTLDLSSPSYTSVEDYKKRIHRAVPQEGDIVFTREAPMGEVCMIPKGLKCCLGQRQVLLRPKKKISGQYLFWALQSAYVQHQVSWNEGTGSTVSNVRIPVLKALRIPRLESGEDSAAKALSSIADKIELNRKINQTLEQIAQAIFKSWFVDFDPVKAKIWANENGHDPERAAMCALAGLPYADDALDHLNPEQQQQLATTAALFPDTLEESELGEIPSGWSIGVFSTIAEIVMGQSPKGDAYNDSGEGIALINGPVEFGLHHPVKSKWTTEITKLSKDRDLVVCVRGSTTGRFVKSDGIYCLGRGVCAIRSDRYQPFVDYTFKNELSTLLGLTTGSTFPSWNGPTLKQHKILIPDIKIIARFSEVITPTEAKISANDKESQQLAQLRDTLLPKLLSGELSVADLSEVADAGASA